MRDELPEGMSLLDLGRHRLKDLSQPEHIRQLVMKGLPSEFPPLKSLEMLPPELPLGMEVVQLPAFFEQEEASERLGPVFVARKSELGQLDGYLDEALAGNGKVAFVTGDPGRGKTTLINRFAQHAMDTHPDMLAVMGSGNAYTGAGDPDGG